MCWAFRMFLNLESLPVGQHSDSDRWWCTKDFSIIFNLSRVGSSQSRPSKDHAAGAVPTTYRDFSNTKYWSTGVSKVYSGFYHPQWPRDFTRRRNAATTYQLMHSQLQYEGRHNFHWMYVCRDRKLFRFGFVSRLCPIAECDRNSPTGRKMEILRVLLMHFCRR